MNNMNNLENFIAGEVVVSVENNIELWNFYNNMIGLGFYSIKKHHLQSLKQRCCKGFVVQYLPSQGFVFDTIDNLNKITADLYQEKLQIINLNNLFIV